MEIQQVTVVGGGAMGSQIALNTAIHGIKTALYDVNPAIVAKAAAWAEEYLAGRVAKGRLTQSQADAAAVNIRFDSDLGRAVAEADLVIEAVVEDEEVKRKVFAELDQLAPAHAILATNSSTMVSSRLVDATRPQRHPLVANLHYFNPALVMECVEVVQGPHTAPETADALMEFGRRTGKAPVRLTKEISGFIANRILHAVAREAMSLYENGYADFKDIDTAVEKALGYPMGPFKLMDLTGIDVAYLVRMQKYRESGNEADKPARSIVERYERGEFGRKSGKGWYEYPQGK